MFGRRLHDSAPMHPCYVGLQGRHSSASAERPRPPEPGFEAEDDLVAATPPPWHAGILECLSSRVLEFYSVLALWQADPGKTR